MSNLGLSLRKTSEALKDLYNIRISHQQVANYARTAALVIKPFVDNYDYKSGTTFVADETYIKVRGIKGYIWFIMDAVSRSILGYQVSDNRSVGPCILAMRMAFRKLKELAGNFRFIADGVQCLPSCSPAVLPSIRVRSSTLILPRSSGLRTRTKSPKSSALSNR